jgi:adenylosuccinate lyase
VIKEHAVAAALSMREGHENNLLDAIASDDRIPFTRSELDALIGNPIEFTGDAREQVSRVVAKVEVIAKKYPSASTYKPGSIR